MYKNHLNHFFKKKTKIFLNHNLTENSLESLKFLTLYFIFYVDRSIFSILKKDIITLSKDGLLNFKKIHYQINTFKLFNSLLIGNFIQKGNRIKSLNLLCNYSFYIFFYNLVKTTQLSKFISSPSALILKTFFKTNVSFFNYTFLFAWALNLLAMQFHLKCTKIPKQLKTKTKTKYNINLKYIFKRNRARVTLKFIFNILKINKMPFNKLKASPFLFDLFFSYKSSIFYKNKIQALQEFIKLNR